MYCVSFECKISSTPILSLSLEQGLKGIFQILLLLGASSKSNCFCYEMNKFIMIHTLHAHAQDKFPFSCSHWFA